jgi:WD40 repeat protein
VPRLAYPVQSLSFQPNSHRLVFVSQRLDIEIWDVAAGEKADSFPGEGLESGMLHSALSRDGTWLATGGGGRSVAVWDLSRRGLSFMLPQERSTVWSIAWSPDRKLLAVGSSSGSLVLWDFAKIRQQLDEIGLAW